MKNVDDEEISTMTGMRVVWVLIMGFLRRYARVW